MSGIYFGRKPTLLAALDVLMIVASLVASFIVRFRHFQNDLVSKILDDWTGATLVVITVHLLAFYVFELYSIELDFRRVGNVFRSVGAVAFSSSVVAVASFVVPRWGFGRGLFFLHAILLALLTATSRAIFSRLAQSRTPTEKALLVTNGPVSPDVITEMSTNLESRFLVVGTVPVSAEAPMPKAGERTLTPPPMGALRDTEAVLKREGAVNIIVANIDTLPQEAARELLRLKTKGIEVHELSAIFEKLSGRIPLEHVSDSYFLRVPAFTGDTRPMLSNFLRVLDVIVSVVLMILSSPLWVLAFVGIKLTMPGPVFYSQERVGKDEKIYTIHKFRSMGVDAEKGGAKWATPGDPRVTPFGRFMRRTRIDELPQIWNVLKGDMSLVGPRPERRVFVDQLKQEIPFYGLRFGIKPGLTGWAQVMYRYGASVDDTKIKLSYDLYYIQERSVLLFALILLKTVQTVLFKPGS